MCWIPAQSQSLENRPKKRRGQVFKFESRNAYIWPNSAVKRDVPPYGGFESSNARRGIYPVATFSDHRNVPEVFKRFGRGNMPRPAPVC